MNTNDEKEYTDFVSTNELLEFLGLSPDDEEDLSHTGNGYAGISMSNNALDAYAKGRNPSANGPRKI